MNYLKKLLLLAALAVSSGTAFAADCELVTSGDLDYIRKINLLVAGCVPTTTASGLPIIAAGGTVDAITATFSPAVTLTNKVVVAVVSGGANTSATPTFAPNGLTAHTITARGGAALVAGDIGAAGFVALLEYNSAGTRWELMNPAKVRAASDLVGTITTANIPNTAVTPGAYTNGNFTVDAQGRLTAASSGSGGSLTSTYIGYGDGSNNLTGNSSFVYAASTGVWSSSASRDGESGLTVVNNSNGGSATTYLRATNDPGGSSVSLLKTSTAYAGAGGLSANQAVLLNSAGTTMFLNSAATDFIFASNGAQVFRVTSAGHIVAEGVTSTGATGTGKIVFDGSPALTTPNLGTPSALVATNVTGTAAGLTAGNVTTNANLTGDVTSSGNATTLATVNSNVGTYGSATKASVVTVNGKGLVTAASESTVTPAVGSITGLGANVATALGIAVGSAGGPVTFNGAGGAPSSITLTNGTGLPGSALMGAYTASGMTMATARMLGRTTAATGAVEEISIGNGLTFASGLLSEAVSIGTSAPGSPLAGNLWWKSDDGTLKIYYNDGSSSQWVDAFASTQVTFLPQNSKSVAYTTVLSDAGGHIYHPDADTTARTFTIDSNANVPYVIGTMITIVNGNGAGVITLAITSDTLRLSGGSSTGSRTIAANCIVTVLKVTATVWYATGGSCLTMDYTPELMLPANDALLYSKVA